MATVDATSDQQQTRPQPYRPKLLYRNATTHSSSHSSSGSICTVSTTSTTPTISTVPTSPSQSDYCPSISSPGAPTDTTNVLKPQSPPSANSPSKNSKKKISSFFSFLSVKEPSKQAWLDYQEELRKQSASDNRRVTAVGLPMVSSAKLPTTVPKVNSKWDGVPETVKEREKNKKHASHQKTSSGKPINTAMPRVCNLSRSSSRSTKRNRGRCSIFSTSARTTYSANDSELAGDVANTRTSSAPADSSCVHTRPQPTTSPLEGTSVLLADTPEPPNIPDEDRKESQTDPGLPLDPPSLSGSPALTPAEPPPITPSRSSPCTPITSVPRSDSKMFAKERQDTIIGKSSFEQVTIHSAGTNILGPPTSARRKPKTRPSLAGEAQEVLLPEEINHPRSILKRENTPRKTQTPERPPLSSYFPYADHDTMETSNDIKSKSPLDLALKSRPVGPWDFHDRHEEEGHNERALTPTPRGARNLLRRHKLFPIQ
ncbi:hypothetical protein MMC24_002206 [Lignoscripta atroalba]|nr:hypothetical protein [Lignoscripta atroalba]